MSDQMKLQVNVEAQRNWLREHMEMGSLVWSDMAKRTGIAQGTISTFGGGTYKGDNHKIALVIQKYRAMLSEQAKLEVEAPEVPGYYETPTSMQITNLLHWAQRGRIVLAAMGSGMSKTSTGEHFASCYPNVFLATMTPSTSSIQGMQSAVLEALGETNATGRPLSLSRRIKDRLRNLTNPVLILDEVQHLSTRAFDEARGWHDGTGAGLALMGNLKVMQTLEGGSRSEAFAQIFSRIGLQLVRAKALDGDADALADAWGIEGTNERDFIRKIAGMPGALRGTTTAVEIGSMVAQSKGVPLGLPHLQDAWAQISSRGAA